MHVRGTCYAYLAIDLGFAIDLGRAERGLAREQVPSSLKRPRRAPEPARFERRSLRAVQAGEALELGRGFRTDESVDIALWEFGAATFGYRVALDTQLTELVQLSDLLWDHPGLLADARKRAQLLLDTIGPAVDKPRLGERFEDYVAFELKLPADTHVDQLWTAQANTCAKILRGEPGELSQEEVVDALSMRCAYVPEEVVLIDWFAALLVGEDMDDERLVLELAVAELLELRHLDEQLDRGVDAAYPLLARGAGLFSALRTRSRDLAHVLQLQVDAAVLFEGVDNALKLFGDQYLARLYRIAASRFRLPQWAASAERKLRVLDSIYEKLASQATSRRFEVLEVVIVVLIAVSTAAPLLSRLWP